MTHPLLKKKKMKKEVEVSEEKQEKALAVHKKKKLSKIDYLKYQAMWSAFHENPSAAHVARTTGVSKELAAFVIEEGWPEEEMMPLSERLRKIRKLQQDISDYDLAKANAEVAQFTRGVFLKIRKALGAKFENFGLKEGAMKELTPGQLLTFSKAIETLARLQAFALNDGADRSIRETRRVGGEKGFGIEEKATGKLAALTDTLRVNLEQLKEKKIIEEAEVFDAEFEEVDSFQLEDTQEPENSEE